MTNDGDKHLNIDEPERFVARFADRIRADAAVLDIAAGSGRNGLMFLARGHGVTFIDRNTNALDHLSRNANSEVIQADLETDESVFSDGGVLAGRVFDGIIVVNYLHRPLFPAIMQALVPGGVLLYSTFMVGNEAFGKPSNPEFLLKPRELLVHVGQAKVIAFEEGEITRADGSRAMRQSIAAIKRGSDHRPE